MQVKGAMNHTSSAPLHKLNATNADGATVDECYQARSLAQDKLVHIGQMCHRFIAAVSAKPRPFWGN